MRLCYWCQPAKLDLCGKLRDNSFQEWSLLLISETREDVISAQVMRHQDVTPA